tara:strand:- start:163 stop:741 length:579 start_codon:yes stop_codon:yes gene_type:complete
MKAIALILLLSLSATSASADLRAELKKTSDITLHEARLLVRQPYGTETLKAAPDFWFYDGFRITGDIFFYKMIVKGLKRIESGTPEYYSKVKKWVHTIHPNGERGSYAIFTHKTVVIGMASVRATPDGLVAILLHEFQHCIKPNGSEGAACFAVDFYGEKLKLHPIARMWPRIWARDKYNYTIKDWNKLEPK